MSNHMIFDELEAPDSSREFRVSVSCRRSWSFKMIGRSEREACGTVELLRVERPLETTEPPFLH